MREPRARVLQRHDSRMHATLSQWRWWHSRMRLPRGVTDKLSKQIIGRPQLESNRRVWLLHRGIRLRE